MVQVHTQLTQQDFIRFNFGHFFRTTLVRVLLGIFSFVFIMSVFNIIMTNLSGQTEDTIFGQLLSLLIMPGIFALSCWSVYSQSKRNYSTSNSIHEPITYSFADTGIHIKGKSFESNLMWNTIHKVLETKRWFIFYQNNVAANIIPKTSFENQEQVRALRELISSRKNLKYKLKKA